MENKTNQLIEAAAADIKAKNAMHIVHTNRVEKIDGEWHGIWEGTNAEGKKFKLAIRQITEADL